jgi:pyruvate-formate lyase-activating enzyme
MPEWPDREETTSRRMHIFLPGTAALSFGTAGCNLVCKFCQNWDISRSRTTDTLADVAPPEVIAEAFHRPVVKAWGEMSRFHRFSLKRLRARNSSTWRALWGFPVGFQPS